MIDHIQIKRFSILGACMLMLLFLGTNQAWSVFVGPLQASHGFSSFQMQLIFSTGTVAFCTAIIFAGRLHDRFGPRPLAVASAVLIGLAWGLAWAFGDSYIWLWLAVGVLASSGSAVGYVCPLATAMKWFPHRPGLVSGLAAAGFAGGPILLSMVAEALMRSGWQPIEVFGLVAVTYAPAVLLTGLALVRPAGQEGHAEVARFRRRELVGDRRFWSLWAGMFTGTFPFLLVMGNAKPLAVERGLSGAAAAVAISVLAAGNACGRVFWGLVLDRVGPRRSMLAAQTVMIGSVAALLAQNQLGSAVFFVSLFGIGFCYGSNFAIYPATVSRLYGAHVLGSVYPFIIASQAFSSFGASANGLLRDATGSSMPGLLLALVAAVLGSAVCIVLSRSLSTVSDRQPSGSGSGATRTDGS